MIDVLEILTWHTMKTVCGGDSGLLAQVTVCRLDGVTFVVRENSNALPTFCKSSNERWGDKIGRKPRMSSQVLELLAPESEWDRIAAAVRAADTLNRPVRRNTRLTWKFVDRLRKMQRRERRDEHRDARGSGR